MSESEIHVTDYWKMRRLVKEDLPFYAALAYLIHKADSVNLEKIRYIWPDEVTEMQQRYNAPAGAITPEEEKLAQKMLDEGKMNILGEVSGL